MTKPLTTIDAIEAMAKEQIPFVDLLGCEVLDIDFGKASLCAGYDPKFLRPGGTVSGPVLMALADYSAFAAILTRIGIVPLAVTTNLTINFLSRPEPMDVLADARVLKLGRRLATCDVHLYSGSASVGVTQDSRLVAHATVTYALPPADDAAKA